MGLSFFERMHGELIDAVGRPHPVEFHLKCEATHLSRLITTGELRLTGIVQAPPWAEDAPLEGQLRMAPLTDRRLEYDLAFLDGEGHSLRLRSTKSLTWLAPVRSMTRMQVELTRDGTVIASGQMVFELGDLPGFLASWSPRTSIRTVPLPDAVAPEDSSPEAHTSGQAELLKALSEALLVPGEAVPAGDAETARRTEAVLAGFPTLAGPLYRSGLSLLDRAARMRFGCHFSTLPVERRRRLLQELEGLSTGRALVAALATPIKTAHFSRRSYQDRIGIPDYANPVSEPEPRWMRNVTVPEAMDEETLVDADVVIVGSGAGGGPVAALLAERGLAVVVLEEGRYEQRAQFTGPPEVRMRHLWRDGGMTIALGNVPVGIPTGRLVGGSTAINSGTCYRTPDAILAEWSAAGFPEDFTPERFRRWLDLVETELQVTPGEKPWLGRIAEAVAKGAEQMGGRHGPLRRNAPGCDGQGQCVVGCPTDARRSSNVSWIPRALRAGAQLYTGLPVARVLMQDRRAVAVEARGTDVHGARRVLRVRGRAIVVAGGSLQSPVLLASSGIRLPWIGRNLSIHPALGALAMFDQDMDAPWRAIPQGYYVEGLVDPRVRYEGFYVPPPLSAPALPFWGEELTRWMDAWPRVGQFGFMVRDRGVGRVRAGAGGRPFIRYTVTPDVVDLWTRGSSTLAELLLRGGAREVSTGIDGVGTVKNLEQARAIASMRLPPQRFRAMGFHPLGTCRMGPTPQDSVVDFENRVYGTENLFVVDGSTVPTSLGVNPQITIMAMAARAAEYLGSSLS